MSTPRLTVSQLLASAPTSRYMAELAAAAEYGVKGIFRDADDTLEVRVYTAPTGAAPWDRQQATRKAEAARRHQIDRGLLDDAHLVTRVPGGAWRPAIAA
ncbi:hypothetical protein ACFQ08_08600 [Streptosporangium algeriense]|uniref:Uncharacterized protein n=1 Tax=Streptosporangium algeriense TaxID=1682748 RepID=A0ABW3DMU7_9ACTN